MSFNNLPILRHGLMLRHEDIMPDSVFEQRWNKIKRMMRDHGVDSLLVYSDTVHDGMVCYLTNYPCYSVIRQAAVVLSLEEGPFLYTSEPGRNLPKVQNFICCPVEKERHWLPAACKKAGELAGNGVLGLAGKEYMPAKLARELNKELAGFRTKDLSLEFNSMMAAKDESNLLALRKAVEKARQGVEHFRQKVVAGKPLYRLHADVDYYLRLAGCENTNILSGVSSSGRVRPGLPEREQLIRDGDRLLVYVGAQYARQWGVAGVSLIVKNSSVEYSPEVGYLKELQEQLGSKVVPGMTIGNCTKLIKELAKEKGIGLAPDFPVIQGIGYDLCEHPFSEDSVIGQDNVLQVILVADVERGGTGMLVDLLQVTGNGGIWLSRSSS